MKFNFNWKLGTGSGFLWLVTILNQEFPLMSILDLALISECSAVEEEGVGRIELWLE